MGRRMLFHSIGAATAKTRSPPSLCLDSSGMFSNPKLSDLRDLEMVWWASRLLM